MKADSESHKLEKMWAVVVALTAIIFNMCISSSLAAGGLGISYRDGQYIWLQGKTTKGIDQRVGAFLFACDRSLLLLVPLAIILTALVHLQTGSLRPRLVLQFEGSDSYQFYLSLAGWLFVIPWAVGTWKIIERVFIST